MDDNSCSPISVSKIREKLEKKSRTQNNVTPRPKTAFKKPLRNVQRVPVESIQEPE